VHHDRLHHMERINHRLASARPAERFFGLLQQQAAGLAAAQEFDREGARVAICGLNERSLQGAKERLGDGRLGGRAACRHLKERDTMFATIRREFGHLNGVLVNAGYSEFLPFEEVTEQSFDKVIAVNFKGPYFTIQKAVPLLRQGSSVIITASVGAYKGWPTT